MKSKSIRVWLIVMAAILWLGIYLTGFSKVSWVFYVPAVGFIFTAISGFCPGYAAINKMLG
ncbi:MAG TPA: YgaP-like transmembrane domain [Mucilaginibacter sp.]|jgi:hypothetical protein|nr:YgaP-like transmembrane domain [Mucilaginibacter sp.]